MQSNITLQKMWGLSKSSHREEDPADKALQDGAIP